MLSNFEIWTVIFFAMAVFFDKKDLKVPKQEPVTILEKLYAEVFVEFLVIGVILVAFWKIAKALKLF